MKKSELLELIKDFPDDADIIILNQYWDPKWQWMERAVNIRDIFFQSGLITLRTFKKSN